MNTTALKTRTNRKRTALSQATRDHGLHLSGIGAWYQIGGALGLTAAVLLPIVGSKVGLGGVGLIGGAVIGAISLLAFGIGHGLRMHQGWARIAATILIVLAAFSQVQELAAGKLLSPMFGMAWNGAVLWALFCERGSQLFAVGPRRGEEGPFYTSPFFYLPIVMFFVGLMLAFAF